MNGARRTTSPLHRASGPLRSRRRARDNRRSYPTAGRCPATAAARHWAVPFAACFSFAASASVIGHGDALVLARGAVLAAALRGARHRQARLGAAMQVLNQEPRGLRRPCPGSPSQARRRTDRAWHRGHSLRQRTGSRRDRKGDDVAGDGGIRQAIPVLRPMPRRSGSASVVRGGEERARRAGSCSNGMTLDGRRPLSSKLARHLRSSLAVEQCHRLGEQL